MKKLYVSSLEAYTGKSAICLGLATNYKRQGLNVGYMKPLGTVPVRIDDTRTDEDCVFICRALQCSDPLPLCSPLLLSSALREKALNGEIAGLGAQIVDALNQLSLGKDLIVFEGTADLAQGRALDLSAAQVIDLIDAKAVLVAKYRADLSLDQILHGKDMLGDRLLGIIMNSVPQTRMEEVKRELGDFLLRHGLQLYGAVRSDPILTAIPVRELVNVLGGDVLCCDEALDDLVESFMIGAMSVDSALRLFQTRANKAVIAGGDRSDIHLAALETPTKALILTGNLYPVPVILSRAAEKGVPVILVRQDTMTAVNTIERVMGRIRLGHPSQLLRLEELARQDIRLGDLLQAL